MFGVAVLASVFTSYGGYESGQAFVDGLVPAVWVGAVVVALGAVAALFIPRKRRPAEVAAGRPSPSSSPKRPRTTTEGARAQARRPPPLHLEPV